MNFEFINKVANFLRSVRAELSKVSWPSKEEVTTMTVLIIGMVILLSAYIGGGLDTMFREIIKQLLAI